MVVKDFNVEPFGTRPSFGLTEVIVVALDFVGQLFNEERGIEERLLVLGGNAKMKLIVAFLPLVSLLVERALSSEPQLD